LLTQKGPAKQLIAYVYVQTFNLHVAMHYSSLRIVLIVVAEDKDIPPVSQTRLKSSPRQKCMFGPI